MQVKSITVIGGGNLGGAIAEGILAAELIASKQLTVTRRKLDRLAHLQEKGARLMSDNRAAVADAEVVILALKPFRVKDVLEEIRPALDPKRHLLISVATGVSLADMAEVVGSEMPMVRAMPNTAAAIGQSMTCLAATGASGEQRAQALAIFETLGKAIFIDEELMASATVLGACGTAFALRFIRAASQGGIQIGFDAKTAQLVAAQTVKGAAELLLENGQHPEHEIDKVTTPQGCTIVGLNEMEHQGFSSALIRGVMASFRKIGEM